MILEACSGIYLCFLIGHKRKQFLDIIIVVYLLRVTEEELRQEMCLKVRRCIKVYFRIGV